MYILDYKLIFEPRKTVEYEDQGSADPLRIRSHLVLMFHCFSRVNFNVFMYILDYKLIFEPWKTVEYEDQGSADPLTDPESLGPDIPLFFKS